MSWQIIAIILSLPLIFPFMDYVIPYLKPKVQTSAAILKRWIK